MLRGVPDSGIPVIIASVTDSTLKQYDAALKLWWHYCRDNNLSMFNATVSDTILFLTKQMDKVSSYGTLNSYRSALSLISLTDLGSDVRMRRFFKGVAKLKPQKPKYKTTWDPRPVLLYAGSLNPNENLSLEQLTKKLVILIALTTAQRVQTLALISINNIEIFDNEIQIKIPDHIKTSARNRCQPCLSIPFFRENPEICVASALQIYMKVTVALRQSKDTGLFITYRKPYHKASSQTISRWIKQTLAESGIDTTVFSAHSTRHASTSAASRNGINVEIIRQTAGWTESSEVFARFYNRPIVNSSVFASAVIKGYCLGSST